MFVFSLQKRHKDNSTLCELASRLLACFLDEMPIPPSQLFAAGETGPCSVPMAHFSPLRALGKGSTLPLLANGHRNQSPHRPLFSPTTMSKLYQEAPSPYSPNIKLPLPRQLTSPVQQARRAQIFSMPKLAAVEGPRQYRCNTPNAPPSRVERSTDIEANQAHDPAINSPPQSPSGSRLTKSRIAVSDKTSWNSECINSASGFDWWWRSLPQNHACLERTQKLKMVTKAAVRLHSKGELQRAIELYQQALSSETTDDVQFRLRINLACAYEEAEDLTASIEELRLALELNSQDPYTIYKLGRALTSVGELEEARTRLESIINLHPQAAVGLKILDKAVEGHKLEEARRATIAAAKTRRSPFEVLSPSVYCTSPRDPIALLAPIVQSPAPRSKKRRAAKRESAPPTAAAIEKSAPIVSKVPGDIESLPKPETTDAHLASPSLLEILVRRCREAGIDMLEVLKQLDPQQRGLVRRESFMGLLRVLAGIDTLDSDVVVSPDDWVTHKNQVLLHYGGFVQAYTEQYQVEAALVVSNEVGRVKLVIDDLIRNDLTSFSSHNVSEWMRSGCKRAIAELHRNSTLPAGVVLTDNDAAADSWKQSRGTEATRSAPELYTNVVNIFIPRSRARKGRAREEGLLAAEKARVLARRQQRCMKSLRDMASRAKAHIVSRRKAVAFLLMIAQNAVFKVKTRTREEEAVESHTSHDDEAASSTDSTELVLECTSNTVKELSKETYHESVRTAMTRVCPNAQLEDLKTLASHFAAFCQVPPFFLGVQVLKPDEAFGEAGNYDY